MTAGKRILKVIDALLAPPFCAFCMMHFIAWGNEPGLLQEIHICQQCLSALPRRTGERLLMPTLDQRLRQYAPELARYDGLTIAALDYTEPVAHAIRNLKFHEQTALSKPLGYLLSEALKRCDRITGNEILIPLPLHAKRQRERGYNQTALLARSIRKHLPVEVDEGMMVRSKVTQRQSEMNDVLARVSNVEGAFELRAGRDLSGCRFIVLDDVLTSGATLVSAFKTLKEAGASEVIGLAVASGRQSL